MEILLLVGVVALFLFTSILEVGTKKPGLLMLLVLPLAILTLPFKLAAEMMGGRKRR